ncbi:hypothetical protein SPI_03049 [Niveomyces insectorum RCEF 264]|uniref:Uncharacterized protein n=1 Tax=Niveomyces insectorum RCEF 264 TaxID=1081102 RepID=A0A162J6F7_9HYPO|nr:hypothetical protein SPI_03049 [Niveomyces insectorum RCEF 264]
MNRAWNDRADKDLFFTILSVKNIGVISGAEWIVIGNHLRTLGYGFTNEGCRQHFQGLRRMQSKFDLHHASPGGSSSSSSAAAKADPTLNPITRRPGPGRRRSRKHSSVPSVTPSAGSEPGAATGAAAATGTAEEGDVSVAPDDGGPAAAVVAKSPSAVSVANGSGGHRDGLRLPTDSLSNVMDVGGADATPAVDNLDPVSAATGTAGTVLATSTAGAIVNHVDEIAATLRGSSASYAPILPRPPQEQLQPQPQPQLQPQLQQQQQQHRQPDPFAEPDSVIMSLTGLTPSEHTAQQQQQQQQEQLFPQQQLSQQHQIVAVQDPQDDDAQDVRESSLGSLEDANGEDDDVGVGVGVVLNTGTGAIASVITAVEDGQESVDLPDVDVGSSADLDERSAKRQKRADASAAAAAAPAPAPTAAPTPATALDDAAVLSALAAHNSSTASVEQYAAEYHYGEV